MLPEGQPPHYARGTVGHAKPVELVGKPNTVSCALFNQLSAEELFELHEDAAPIEGPQELKPFFQ